MENKNKLLAVNRLNRLLETTKSDSAELELDKMYITVLEYSFVAVTDDLTPEEAEKSYWEYEERYREKQREFQVAYLKNTDAMFKPVFKHVLTYLNENCV